MYDWTDFDAVFHAKRDISIDNKHADAAVKHRKELGGRLFFDRMWTALRLDKRESLFVKDNAGLTVVATKAYPPKSNAELRNLWKNIIEANSPDEQKLALLYYLMLDCRKQNLQQTFAQRSYLPQKYQVLVTGLWQLDQCHFAQALEYLTDPSLIPLTFADEILTALLQHPKCDSALAMAYYLTVRPPLHDVKALDAYYALLMQINLTEAFNFAASHPQHKRLFETLVCTTLGAKQSEARAEAAVELIGLPFSAEEEQWFEECLFHGGAAKSPGAKDTLMMRRIATGKLQGDPSALARYKGNKVDGVNWDDIRSIMNG